MVSFVIGAIAALSSVLSWMKMPYTWIVAFLCGIAALFVSSMHQKALERKLEDIERAEVGAGDEKDVSSHGDTDASKESGGDEAGSGTNGDAGAEGEVSADNEVDASGTKDGGGDEKEGDAHTEENAEESSQEHGEGVSSYETKASSDGGKASDEVPSSEQQAYMDRVTDVKSDIQKCVYGRFLGIFALVNMMIQLIVAFVVVLTAFS